MLSFCRIGIGHELGSMHPISRLPYMFSAHCLTIWIQSTRLHSLSLHSIITKWSSCEVFFCYLDCPRDGLDFCLLCTTCLDTFSACQNITYRTIKEVNNAYLAIYYPTTVIRIK
ncbi:hypothetical protein GIB67_036462 [Kingdonia uniflora]|uniref:Uncharacterized protein n=1 Tax=Kingdonia uniflora TaxID=39325 RepID=A0A7J7MHK4_9MAGN|nr:hypothetical protein GIB67_036462 [Kingdonia uniflora]